ncbi:hypothetical protein E4665_13200 [Sporolactobacillus shoreae]|uniref:Uncharacterized protein n=1 Tax=Sporolactobacillus shoreae TaxID=1465501 RepID=A0A4Z0GJK8_9BACL|nr:hypothetical protein [Sporolactobacillus shoreae]TGA96999.1 hypothetical protein E4665_13200 [Sporolactobacillus shoreae]
MPKFLSNTLKVIFVGACLVFIYWGIEAFLVNGSIYTVFGWCYLMLGTVAPSVVLLGHSEWRREGKYLSERTRLRLETMVLIGIIILLSGVIAPIGFIGQLIFSLVGFMMAVPSSFVYLYLSPPRSSKVGNAKK